MCNTSGQAEETGAEQHTKQIKRRVQSQNRKCKKKVLINITILDTKCTFSDLQYFGDFHSLD